MSDNFYSSILGPSLVGALNVVAGQTHGAKPTHISLNISYYHHDVTYHQVANGTLIGDIDSIYDDCSEGKLLANKTISMTGKNVGNLMKKGS